MCAFVLVQTFNCFFQFTLEHTILQRALYKCLGKYVTGWVLVWGFIYIYIYMIYLKKFDGMIVLGNSIFFL